MKKTKYCNTCRRTLPVTAFHKRMKNGKQVYQSLCKECRSKADRERYANESPKQREHRLKLRRTRAGDNRKKVLKYLKDHPCVDCKETNPVILTFDHRDPSKKCFEISNGMDLSWERLEKEINKCDVRCFNCHMAKTAKDQNWYSN